MSISGLHQKSTFVLVIELWKGVIIYGVGCFLPYCKEGSVFGLNKAFFIMIFTFHDSENPNETVLMSP